jgi:uncharacterized protein (DUF305 family)
VLVTIAAIGLLIHAVPADAAAKRGQRGADSRPETASAPDAERAPAEAQYLDTMLAHDQAAVEMAKLVKARSERPELIDLAANIFQTRRLEIEQLRAWHQRWHKTVPRAVNLSLPGMQESLDAVNTEKLRKAHGAEFDRLFLQMMIPHHQASVRMSDWIKSQTSRRELKEFADRVSSEQQREIEQMAEWQAAWAQAARPES